MCNFNKQDTDIKEFMSALIHKCSQSVGGDNFLLSLIEALRAQKPHPLTYPKCKISSEQTEITWSKIVFKDKLDVLQSALLLHKSSEAQDFNLLNIQNAKKKKALINTVKTLAPITFIAKPKESENGAGFEFSIFEKIDFEKDYVKINPLFTALFFCSTDYTKQALKYKV
jgi:hypothetical protein